MDWFRMLILAPSCGSNGEPTHRMHENGFNGQLILLDRCDVSLHSQAHNHLLTCFREHTHFAEKNTLQPIGSIAARTPYLVSRNIIILVGLSREKG